MEEPGPTGRLTIQPNFVAEPGDLAALAALAVGPAAPDRRLTLAERIDFVRTSCSTFFYPCGTCAMGLGAVSVVDPELRVWGVDGLRIADASVIPIIPSCNTQAPVIALAERAADLIRGWKTRP